MLWLKPKEKLASDAKGSEAQPRPGGPFAGKMAKEEPQAMERAAGQPETAQEARKSHYEKEAALWEKRKGFAEAGRCYEQATEKTEFGRMELLLNAIECYVSEIKEEQIGDPLIALKISELFGKIGKKNEAAEWERNRKKQLAAVQGDDCAKGAVDLARLKRFVMSGLYAGDVMGATVLSYQALLIAKRTDNFERTKNWVLDTFSYAAEEMPARAEQIMKNLGKLMAVE